MQRPLYALLERQGALRAVLNGTWLGLPIHAAVTDLPVGAWASGLILDLFDLLGVNAFGGRRNVRAASDAVHTIGLAGALGSALFGLADWSYTAGRGGWASSTGCSTWASPVSTAPRWPPAPAASAPPALRSPAPASCCSCSAPGSAVS